MIGEKTTSAKYWAELKMADAVPRSAVGNHADTMRLLPGNDGASARPSRKRRKNREATAMEAGSTPTKPCRSVKTDQMSTLRTYTRFEPNRSRSQPPGICART